MADSKFVHLHTHTEYSLLDGLSKIPKLVKTAKDLGMEALAITDHGSMYGAIEFYKACNDAGIKPIIGCEMYVAPRSHKSKEGKADTEPYHLTVLAKDYQGYLNLMKLVSISYLDGFYYKPRVDKTLLREYHDGLIALSACPAGEFIRALTSDNYSKGEAVAKEYLGIFGEGNYYLELQNHFYKDLLARGGLEPSVRTDLENMGNIQDITWAAAKEISKKLSIPLVATNDLHYIKKEDAQAQDCLVCIQTGKTLNDLNRLRMVDTPDLYLKSAEEMSEGFKDLPEALENSVKIANKINIEIPLGNPKFPIFEVPGNKPPMEYLKELTYERAEQRMEISPERKERLDYELSIIEKKKYSTYFLVVQDFINWAHQQGIITNTRGSAAGSLVLYALGVTNIDPIHYKIPFERFLNPMRPSLPDIDSDMADDRRDEVIRYVAQKYGEDKVAHIVTFGTMMGRAAIRDIGRVMGIAYGEVDRIAKLVPPPHQGFHKPLPDAIKEVPELADLYKTDAQYKKLLDLACKVESTVRHASVHAAGIVIAPEPLTTYTPLQREANGDKIVSQYDMFSVEDTGLVKMDFLGIRNLSILGRAVEYVKKNRGLEVDLDNIPLDDKKAFELLAEGETMGLFQLEGSGMTKWLVDLKPTSIYDIMAMIALYRPGPMGSIPDYIQRKHDPSKITFFDPRMKEYMQQSLGLLVYQEDVLLTAINIAGYSWLDADKFRKAMGKKIPAEMAKQKDSFIKGAVVNGMPNAKAQELWALIEPFAAYGFPKAHAASYGMISYQTAYMKANFPVEFMAAVMTAEYGNTEKIAHAIEECKRMGIVVLPPDINYSGIGFTIEDLSTLSEEQMKRNISNAKPSNAQTQGIRFGLSAIKNVGISAIESILKARDKKPFTSLSDLCSRVDNRLVNRKTLEALIKAGAVDSFATRASQLLSLDEVLNAAHKNAKLVSSGQVSLFGDDDYALSINIKLPNIPELELDKLLMFEKELLGFYLHEPPYLEKLKQLEKVLKVKVGQVRDQSVGSRVTFGGVITEIKKVLTKKSASEMAFVKISDGTSEIDTVVFPKTYSLTKTILNKEEVVVISGKLDKREEEFSILIDTVEVFDPEEFFVLDVDDSGRPGAIEDRRNYDYNPGLNLNLQSGIVSSNVSSGVEIQIPQGANADLLKQLNAELKKYPGVIAISILLPSNGTYKRLNLPFTIDPTAELLKNLEQLLGENAVRIN